MIGRRRFLILLLLPLWMLAAVPQAHAQMAVLDAASLEQLATQYSTLTRQLGVQQAYLQGTTGTRGMQDLLSGTQRNYLPPDYTSLSSAAAGGGSYGALGTELQAARNALAVLSASQLGALPPAGSQQIAAQRQSIALLQAITRAALSNSSGRFAGLQQLIDTIGVAQDSKASMDLQARIAAEQGMLQNEQTKLQVLYAGALAQQWADGQRAREQVIATHGRFGTRFQPSPSMPSYL